MSKMVSSLLFGVGVGSASFVYNQAGVLQKLPQDAGYVRPAAVVAGFLGVAAFFCKAALPTRFVWPAVVLTGGGLAIKAINNSIKDIQKVNDLS